MRLLLGLAIAVVVLASLLAWLWFVPSDPNSQPSGTNPVVVIETSLGTIRVELYMDKAPITVKNFLQYVDEGFYDGLVFHRVIKDFMIQGGGFEPGMKPRKTRPPIKNESANGLSNRRGTIAMARTPDPDSATSQFFINVRDNTFLDREQAKDGIGYCVFGRVIEGMEVVDKISLVKTTRRAGHDDVPVEDVLIKSIRREK
ncbi:MAG: peptidylprolyl isomerase [Gemmatales bacterium]|nr:peptidylprolyl isomerase [Gemmatales bacterium]MDW7993488.1 peptidylprolyl isomerase [Gemmatales bacterium]